MSLYGTELHLVKISIGSKSSSIFKERYSLSGIFQIAGVCCVAQNFRNIASVASLNTVIQVAQTLLKATIVSKTPMFGCPTML